MGGSKERESEAYTLNLLNLLFPLLYIQDFSQEGNTGLGDNLKEVKLQVEAELKLVWKIMFKRAKDKRKVGPWGWI